MSEQLVRKLLPMNIYDAPVVEAWLREMAHQGLHLKTLRPLYATFSRGPAQRVEYRLDPAMKFNQDSNLPDYDLLEHYAQAGWEYVCYLERIFFVFRATRPDPEELHSDLDVQVYAYEKLQQRLRRSAMQLIAGLLVTFGIYTYRLVQEALRESLPLLNIVTAGLAPVILLLLFYALLIVDQIHMGQAIKRIKETLLAGVSLRAASRPIKQNRKLVNLLQFLLLLAALLLIPAQSLITWQKTIEDVPGPLPYLTLGQIEQNEDFTLQAPRNYFGYNLSSNVTYRWDPLAPSHYRFVQFGNRREDSPAPEGYQPHAITEYYQLRFTFMAPPLYADLVNHRTAELPDCQIERLAHEAFDELTLFTSPGFSKLLVRQGKIIMEIEYSGYEDLTDSLEALRAVLQR